MTRQFFDEIADALVGFLPRDLRAFASRRGTRNLKVWYGEDAREHYEVQIVSTAALTASQRRGRRPVVEIGFHSEHPRPEENEAALARIAPGALRRALGPNAQRGTFLGSRRTAAWRRISEVWPEADADAETAVEAAERLAAYIRAIEPVRRA